MVADGVTYSDLEVFEVLLGTGDDKFNVLDTADGMITAIHGGGGSDTITILDRGGIDSRGLDASLVIFGDTTEDGTRYVHLQSLNCLTPMAERQIGAAPDKEEPTDD